MLSDVSGRGGASVSVLTNHPEQLLAPIIVIWIMIFCWNIIGDANDILNPEKLIITFRICESVYPIPCSYN